MNRPQKPNPQPKEKAQQPKAWPKKPANPPVTEKPAQPTGPAKFTTPPQTLIPAAECGVAGSPPREYGRPCQPKAETMTPAGTE